MNSMTALAIHAEDQSYMQGGEAEFGRGYLAGTYKPPASKRTSARS